MKLRNVARWLPWVARARSTRYRERMRRRLSRDRAKFYRQQEAMQRELEAQRASVESMDTVLNAIDGLSMELRKRNLPDLGAIGVDGTAHRYLCGAVRMLNPTYTYSFPPLDGYGRLSILGIEIQAHEKPGRIWIEPK